MRYRTGEFKAVEPTTQSGFIDHLPAEKLLEPACQIEERHRVHGERLEWKQRRVVPAVHDQVEARHPKATTRLRVAVGTQHRSAVPGASGNPHIARQRFTGDRNVELLLNGITPHLTERLE